MLTEKIHIAVPTAFHDDESLHIQRTISHIKQLDEQGVKSVLVSGTTGEQHSLRLDEKMDLIDALELDKELTDQLEIIFGVASVRLKDAEKLAEKISQTRISGVMLGYPPYVIPTQAEALAYSKAIIRLSEKPVILYNNPKRTGFDLSAETIIALSQFGQVVGIKDAGSKEKVSQIRYAINRNDFYFYAGGEENLEEKISHGYDRLSSIAGNLAPKEISDWFHKLLEGLDMSESEHNDIARIMKQVYEGNAIVNIKKTLHDMGMCRRPIGMG